MQLLTDVQLVQSELATHQAQFSGTYQSFVCDRYAMQLCLNVFLPVTQEPINTRKTGMDIITLPDKALQQRWVVWHAVKYFGSCQAVPAELGGKIAVGHALSIANLVDTHKENGTACRAVNKVKIHTNQCVSRQSGVVLPIT